jgi:hypothetical protein
MEWSAKSQTSLHDGGQEPLAGELSIDSLRINLQLNRSSSAQINSTPIKTFIRILSNLRLN